MYLRFLLVLTLGSLASVAKDNTSHGRRSEFDISLAFRNKQPLVLDCVKEFSGHEKILGEMRLRVSIESSGQVSKIETITNTTGSKNFEKCVLGVYQKIKMEPGYEPATVEWPLKIKGF